MKRREFISLLGGAAVGWPRAARAQQPDRVLRIGVLGPPIRNPAARIVYPFFVSELRKLGFTNGKNVVVEFRRIDEGVPKAFAAANELVAAKAHVLFAFGPELAMQAAAAVRPAVPIVMLADNYDPIARGYVSSLARPGGNVTGLFFHHPELAVKQLELLVDAFPGRTRVAALWDEQSADQFSAAERAAQSMRLSLRSIKLENPPYDFTTAFRTMAKDDVQMFLVMLSPLFAQQNARIAKLANQHRLPAMYILRYYIDAGGLMSYGVDFAPMMRRAASFVAKILRGTQPADLPVEQATNFEFVVNLKTARAIGVTLPPSILLRADEVIQ